MHSKISRLIVFSSFEEKYQDTSLKSIAIENSFSKIYPFNLSYKSCKKFRISPDKVYMLPSGYKIRMEKNQYVPSWRLVGTVAEGTFCHKPSTVSGGGKSEISKSINDSILYGPFFVADYINDFNKVDEILNKDYFDRYKNRKKEPGSSRPILSPERSLGSVIKLLTPSPIKYKDEYNEWLSTIPHNIKGLVYIIKRFYKPEW